MSNQSKGRPGGVLPITAVATKKPAAPPAKSVQRSPAPRLRLIIRRLPPGLGETEFWEALGSEWQNGKGKVDWHAFKEGKVSKDPSKPSRPGRAYLRVKDQSLLEILSAKVKATSFKDVKNTAGDPCLVGPPSLEFAPYGKVPSGRNRHDGRQGTIDQDQEFIDFLQSLTEPITKPILNGADSTEAKQEKLAITPLVQFIKEKKANKAKEKEAAAAAKSSKKSQENKEVKVKGESRPTIVVKSSSATTDKARITKATQEAVKAANKAAVQIQTKTTTSKPEQKQVKEQPSTPAVPTKINNETPKATSAPKAERQRGSASAASRMIARDLGLAPKEPRAPQTARNASAAVTSSTTTLSDNAAKVEAQQKTIASTANVVPTAPAPTTTPTTAPATIPSSAHIKMQTPPTGPKSGRSTQVSQSKTTPAPAQRTNKTAAQPSSGAKSAFLKHANPSQGVTEELLRTTFSIFGEVTRCEIDKKKGLGYVDFTETEALKNAMAASPIKVGNGQVVVLENRSPYNRRQGQSGNGTQQQAVTGTAKSRAPSAASSVVASAVTSPQPAPAVIATAEAPKIAAVLDSKSSTAKTPTTTEPDAPPASPLVATTAPTAPKGNRSASAAGRGGRGSHFPNGRGGAAAAGVLAVAAAGQAPNRGRGGHKARGGRGGRAGGSAGSGAAPNSSQTASGAGQQAGNEAAKPPVTDKA